MNRLPAAIALFALVAGAAAPARAATLQDFLNAPVWYVQYEVTVTSAHTESFSKEGVDYKTTSNLTRVMSDTQKLNVRSQGPGSIGMRALTVGMQGGSTSAADAQKLSTDMMAMMETTANWIVGGAAAEEGASDDAIASDMTPDSPSRIDYKKVDEARGMVDEVGGKYDMTTTTTITGEGMVLVLGTATITLEMNIAKKSYALILPFGASPSGPGVTHETVTVITPRGGQPQETRESREQTIDYPGTFTLDEPQPDGMQGGAIIHGTMDAAAGKISGEKTFQAHYTDMAKDIPATIVVKYTLTMTPPKK